MKRIISIILTLAMAASVFAASAVSAGAATYVTDGEWLLAVDSDDTYLIGGYNGADTELVFPESASNGKAIIGVIDSFCDECNSEITSVTMPDSYTYVGALAFYNCSALVSVDFPSSLSSLGYMAFNGCSALESVDLSDAASLKTIPSRCFSGCNSLSSVTLPDGITAVSSYAFSNTSIQSVVVPDGVTTLGANCFYECSSLADVVLPNSLTTIGDNAFYGDTALTSIYIPLSVSSIGGYAFNPMALEGTLTIDCYEGSYAAQYAYENNCVNYTVDELVKGDADNNGKLNIDDVTYIQLYRVGKSSISDDTKTVDRIDVTGDGVINIKDATIIQLKLAGCIDSL